MAKTYIGGIEHETPFKMVVAKPITDNMIVDTFADLANLIAPIGHSAYVVDEAVAYRKKSASLWEVDSEKVDLSDYETKSELDARDTENRKRANHTGSQAATTVEVDASAFSKNLSSSDTDVQKALKTLNDLETDITTDNSLYFNPTTKQLRANVAQITHTHKYISGAKEIILANEPSNINFISVNGTLLYDFLTQWNIDVSLKKITILIPLNGSDVISINYQHIITE